MNAANIKKALQEILLPELQEIKLKLATQDVEFKRLDDRMVSIRSVFSSRFDSLEKRMDAMDKRFDVIDRRFDAVDFQISTAINIHERLAALEARISHPH